MVLKKPKYFCMYIILYSNHRSKYFMCIPSFNLNSNLQSYVGYFLPVFSGEETKAQRDSVTASK